MDKLVQFSNNLHATADQVINSLGLESTLSQYGAFHLVGSYKHRLMVWRDIDIDLVTNDVLRDEDFWHIVNHFFSQKNVTSVTIADNRNQVEANRPRSMYIGLKYGDHDKNSWKIDIRLVSKSEVTSDQTEEILADMNDQMRLNILKIKKHVYSNPKYHREFSGMDIYTAVVRHNITTIAGFEAYLKAMGKSL